MPVDSHWGYVVLLLGNDAGASGSHEVHDQSLRNRPVNNVGNLVFYASAPPPPTGLATALTFQSQARLEITPGASYWMFHNYDFCIEGFLRLPTRADGVIIADRRERTFMLEVFEQGLRAFFSGNGTDWTVLDDAHIGTVPTGWFHFAVYRIGGHFYGAIAGTVAELGTVPESYWVFPTNEDIIVKLEDQAGLCGLRITIGHARYGASNFTPPTLPMPHEGDIAPPPPPVFTRRLNGQVGQPFIYPIEATGEPTDWTAPAGLPPGLALDPLTGVISGTPIQAGTYDVKILATNAGGQSVCALSLLIVIDPIPLPIPHITSPLVTTAYQATPFEYQIEATNEPTSFEAHGLPVGLSVDTATGLISGTPSSNPGSWPIELRATNEHGTGTATLMLTLNPALPPANLPVINSPDTATGVVGNPFTYVITALNYPYSFYASGLPPGLAVNTATGTISGFPTEVGTFHATIEATNNAGTGTARLVIAIAPAPAERPCPPPPFVKSESGPDVPAILCYIPDGCCGPSPCDISEFDLICQIRSLLPEGDPYNNTAPTTPEIPPQYGAITVGCARVGCEQLVLGGCCAMEHIPCQVDAAAPQLAVVDAFGAAAYSVLQALCQMLLELDPCTAKRLVRQWADRMGIKHPDPCGPGWSDRMLVFLICFITQLRVNRDRAINWEFLTYVANRMSADIKLRYAGAFNESSNSSEPYLGGWWTMARDQPVCPPRDPCPPDPGADIGGKYDRIKGGQMLGEVGCAPPNENSPLSLNIIVCPSDITIPGNCNMPAPFNEDQQLPYDREMFEGFWWLLPQMLPKGPLYCVYLCCPADCIV